MLKTQMIAASTIMAGCFLAACSSPPAQEEPPVVLPTDQTEEGIAPHDGKGSEDTNGATLTVYRAGGIPWGMSAMTQPKIKLDGEPIGNCRYKDKIIKSIAPGSYVVSMQTDIIARQKVTLEEGQTIIVKCTILPIGVIVGAPALAIVTEEKARKRLAKIPLQE